MKLASLCLLGLIAGCASTTGSARPIAVVAPPGNVGPATGSNPAIAADAVTRLEGALARTDVLSPEDRYEHAYTVNLAAGERCRVDLSASFDTYLVVRQPGGTALENDDAAEGVLDSRLEFTARVAGSYQFVASSYSPRTAGQYTLTVRRGRAVPLPPPATGPLLAPGVEVAGSLTASSAHGTGGRFEQNYQFEGHRGDLVVVDLASAAFDTYLTLQGPNGDTWISDDITGADTNSRLQTTLPADGKYGVHVSSYRAGATGAYTVRLYDSPPPARVASGPVQGVAGEHGNGSVYGIFVGIRDYGGESANLPHCDEDATELARALRSTGVQSVDQQVILTNADATADSVRQAFARIAPRVTESDVLVFFYSGHGSQLRGTVSAIEPDGLDETIRLRGGNMRDDDFAALVAPVRGLVLFALDSCYSGGFARDVVSAPNRIGVFSSEEDVLSNVAERYRAGGYLSYFLRLGIAGAADVDRDGTLRVGELTDYLFAQFALHRGETATTGNGGGATFQNLAVSRGSVVNTDLLLRYPRD